MDTEVQKSKTQRRQRDKLLENRNGQAGVSWSEHARDAHTQTDRHTDGQTDRRACVAQLHAQGRHSGCGAASGTITWRGVGEVNAWQECRRPLVRSADDSAIKCSGWDQRWRSEVVATWPQTRAETKSVAESAERRQSVQRYSELLTSC